MMNDVVSPSRMATHTNQLPGIYTFTAGYVDILLLFVYSFSFGFYLYLSQVTFNATESLLSGLYLFKLFLGDYAAGNA